jgi:hypothetical protein
MDSQIIWTKNENGTLDRVLGINSNTLLTTNKNISQLSDVDATGVSSQKALIYNSTTEKWEASLPNFADLGDVVITSPQGGDSIKWNSTSNKWVNRQLGYAVITISGRIKDSKYAVNDIYFNLLNPDNYEPDTFVISPFSSSGINIDTTTTFNINGLITGANYRAECNFNYYYTAGGNGAFTIQAANAVGGQLSFNSIGLNPLARVLTSSMTFVRNDLTTVTFNAKQNTFSQPSFVGLTPTNVNITISIIEM